jgi:hypothetical protein
LRSERSYQSTISVALLEKPFPLLCHERIPQSLPRYLLLKPKLLADQLNRKL